MSQFRVSSKKFPEPVVIEADDGLDAKAAFLASHEATRMVGVKVEHVAESDEADTPGPAETEKPAKQDWRDLPSAEKAEFLLSHPTVADRAWTDEQREKGEKRDAFILRVLGVSSSQLAQA